MPSNFCVSSSREDSLVLIPPCCSNGMVRWFPGRQSHGKRLNLSNGVSIVMKQRAAGALPIPEARLLHSSKECTQQATTVAGPVP